MDPLPETPTEPRDYAALNLAWGALVAALLRATRDPAREAPPGAELPVLALASFALTKGLAQGKIGSWVREPVVAEDPSGEKHPKGRGLRYVLGELVTCTRCLGTWSSLGIVGLRVARPREGRIVAGVLAASAVNDVLQTGFSLLAAKADATSAGEHLVRIKARSAEARLAEVESSRAAGG